jgi:hypothetical protein
MFFRRVVGLDLETLSRSKLIPLALVSGASSVPPGSSVRPGWKKKSTGRDARVFVRGLLDVSRETGSVGADGVFEDLSVCAGLVEEAGSPFGLSGVPVSLSFDGVFSVSRASDVMTSLEEGRKVWVPALVRLREDVAFFGSVSCDWVLSSATLSSLRLALDGIRAPRPRPSPLLRRSLIKNLRSVSRETDPDGPAAVLSLYLRALRSPRSFLSWRLHEGWGSLRHVRICWAPTLVPKNGCNVA